MKQLTDFDVTFPADLAATFIAGEIQVNLCGRYLASSCSAAPSTVTRRRRLEEEQSALFTVTQQVESTSTEMFAHPTFNASNVAMALGRAASKVYFTRVKGVVELDVTVVSEGSKDSDQAQQLVAAHSILPGSLASILGIEPLDIARVPTPYDPVRVITPPSPPPAHPPLGSGGFDENLATAAPGRRRLAGGLIAMIVLTLLLVCNIFLLLLGMLLRQRRKDKNESYPRASRVFDNVVISNEAPAVGEDQGMGAAPGAAGRSISFNRTRVGRLACKRSTPRLNPPRLDPPAHPPAAAPPART